MKRLVLAVLLILVSACTTYPPPKTKSVAMQHFTKGADYAAQGKFEEAKEEFEKVSKTDLLYPSIAENLKLVEDVIDKKIESKVAIHLFKGGTYILKGKLDEAIAEYNKAIEINPNLAMAYRFRGFAYAKKHQYDQAISDYTKALEINPRLASAYARRGIAYAIGKRQYDKAISDFNMAIEINPRNPLPYGDRGVSYRLKGQYDLAISDFNKAIDLNPRYAKAYYDRGFTYVQKHQHDQAISDYSKAIDLNPRYAKAYYRRGLSYALGKGDYDRAIADYNKAIEINPRYAEAYAGRGIAYGIKAQHDKAISDYNKAIEINPEIAQVYSGRGFSYQALGQHDKAVFDFNKAKALQEASGPREKQITNAIGMQFVHIQEGAFLMGSPDEIIRQDLHKRRFYHRPKRFTVIKDGFYIQTTEVTQKQWTNIMGENPSIFTSCGGDCPVENVSWFQIQAFIRRLNETDSNLRYRLPTEAEWEYASRAGSNAQFSFGDDVELLDEYAWHRFNSDHKTHKVAQKKPNRWGVFDMEGNVAEWCQDSFTHGKTYKVNRGCTWGSYPRVCGSHYRYRNSPSHSDGTLGFRLVAEK